MTAFEKEAKERWGQTQAYKEYEEKHYSRQVQDALAAGMDRIMAEFALCMKKGEKPQSSEAQSLVKYLQDYITENYYRCTDEILAGLGKMYVADLCHIADRDSVSGVVDCRKAPHIFCLCE